MIKKILCFIASACLLSATLASGATFSDVPVSHPYYDAISSLSEKGILKGYENGTFNPEGNLTRAEAAALIVRTGGLPVAPTAEAFSDVPSSHWAYEYIATASATGIINGMGDGYFYPEENVTHYQFLKMLVCLLGSQTDAEYNGGWPHGYLTVAYRLKIIDASEYNYLSVTQNGSLCASRQDVAHYISNIKSTPDSGVLSVNNREYFLGLTAASLDTPDEILSSTCNFNWYVYGTDTYQNFLAVGVNKDKVVALASTGKGFEYMGYKFGDTNTNNTPNLYTDSNDNNIIHSALITDSKYMLKLGYKHLVLPKQLYDESKINFHFTNAFRVAHNLKPFVWNEYAAKAALTHSEDMATKNFFSHTGSDGSTVGIRITCQGIQWTSCAENIAAGEGRFLGFHSFDGWVNSSGHRSNILGNHTYLGVGIAYSSDSIYNYYHTQNFFTE